ncbi:hypothetical protein ABZ572_30790 [Streptomyces sp. NPDC018338]|uniref:hypothetical protein n=1 Tax=Streptomyces sp. NPDC018338 TaxID=3157192 RepID=UPI00340ED796
MTAARIARAFHRDAPVLVIDEPTAALDARAEHRIFTRLKNLAAGRATLFITHRLANARLADRIVVLEADRIIETGTDDELVQRGIGSTFYENSSCRTARELSNYLAWAYSQRLVQRGCHGGALLSESRAEVDQGSTGAGGPSLTLWPTSP